MRKEVEPILRDPEDLSISARFVIAGTVVAIALGDSIRHPTEHHARRQHIPQAAAAIDQRILSRSNRLLRFFSVGPLQ